MILVTPEFIFEDAKGKGVFREFDAKAKKRIGGDEAVESCLADA